MLFVISSLIPYLFCSHLHICRYISHWECTGEHPPNLRSLSSSLTCPYQSQMFLSDFKHFSAGTWRFWENNSLHTCRVKSVVLFMCPVYGCKDRVSEHKTIFIQFSRFNMLYYTMIWKKCLVFPSKDDTISIFIRASISRPLLHLEHTGRMNPP